jgi:DNA-binding transcriptional LysR family regulator
MIQSRQLEAFRAVMLTGAMTTAGNMINVTQPAVSRLVRDLEIKLGFTLFHRRGNLVVPTAEAYALLEEVKRSYVGLDQIHDFARDLRAGRGGSLRVAALPAMAAGFIPRFVAAFCRARPQLKVSVDGLPSTMIREHVVAGRYEIGITGLQFQSHSSFKITPIDDPAVVAIPAGHPLSKLDVVRPKDLYDQNLILLSKFTRGLHPIELALQAIPRRQLIDTPLGTIACVLVSEGMGIAIVDPFSASEFVGKNVVFRKFKPTLNIGTAIVHSSERKLSKIAVEFRAALVLHARKFLERADYLKP